VTGQADQFLTPAAFFDQLDQWLALTTKPSPAVETKSPLAGDAKKSPDLQVAHAAWLGISSAIDHLHAMKAAIVDARLLHPYAPYSLLRVATENAATAVWLLAPKSRDERLQRRLRLAHNEAREQGKAREFAPDAYLGKRTSEERITEIKDLARSLGLDAGYICGRFSYEKIVEAAGDDADLSGDLAVFTWRLFSGFAHGRYWAMLGMLDQVRHPTDEPDVAQVRLTTTVDKVIKVGHIPFVLTRHALDLFERRRRSPYGPA
jgi:hypothetical protein